MNSQKMTIILPAFNEAAVVGTVVKRLKGSFPETELLVIDDCSGDDTGSEAKKAGATVIRHQYNMGNGAAIKTGARHAKGDVLVFMDADGQHDDRDINRLIDGINEGYELVVGARHSKTQASVLRRFGNGALNWFASKMTGHHIPDLTSGFRAAKSDSFRRYVYLLPNGFSYPTTSTMAFLRSGLPVKFIPIEARKRIGKSKINLVKDGVRFLVIVMKITTLFSPMRFFLPASAFVFLLGVFRYIYFYMSTDGRFSSMAGVMFITALVIFLIGLISEQITALHYGISENKSSSND